MDVGAIAEPRKYCVSISLSSSMFLMNCKASNGLVSSCFSYTKFLTRFQYYPKDRTLHVLLIYAKKRHACISTYVEN